MLSLYIARSRHLDFLTRDRKRQQHNLGYHILDSSAVDLLKKLYFGYWLFSYGQ